MTANVGTARNFLIVNCTVRDVETELYTQANCTANGGRTRQSRGVDLHKVHIAWLTRD